MSDEEFKGYIPQVSDRFAFEPTKDGCLLYEVSTGKMLTLDKAGEFVLTHCSGEWNIQGILKILTRDVGIDATASLQVLKMLHEQGVI